MPHTFKIIGSLKKTILNMTAFLFLLISLAGCTGSASSTADGPQSITIVDGYHFPYDLLTPEQTMEMPDALREISGLGISDDGDHLLAVQDEDGVIFVINRYTGEVEKEYEFWKDGDYEGIEVVGSIVYVVKSSGTLYEVKRGGEPDQAVDKYNFFLDSDNDVEGLAYDRANNRLLLACKAKAGHEKNYKRKKGIYAFGLEDKMLSEEPVYFISLDSVNNYLATDPNIRKLEKIVEFFDPKESFGFSPSAIAIHPITGDIYVTSSVGKMLIVLHPDGRIMHIEKLSKKLYPQPEGLCFDPIGTLYISNEGKDGPGTILRFNYRPE